ncbi:MAG: imidazole glycerol phosphate synthase subunit HisF [Lewinellaceae bacterium]|nr:imidazole glycerol phosphate synthase subunit HisF [Lewinellaceae bacterium]
MLRVRVIPCLLLIKESLVKTIKFKRPGYIGDPINTVRIFNELEVDELCFLDIRASIEGRSPNLDILHQIADECFMPLSYGGGIRDAETAQKILAIGFEKIVINTSTFENPGVISQIANHSGNQSVIGSIDVKRNLWGNYEVYSHDGKRKQKVNPITWAQELEELGVGEILITSIDRDGTWKGYDLDIIQRISETVNVPVIANGGAGNVEHLGAAVKYGHASAVALGSMVVYQQKGMGVLVNFPDREKLKALIG